MLYTGPLMALVVIGVVWGGRTLYVRRRRGAAA
jgi:hypothetical protein